MMRSRPIKLVYSFDPWKHSHEVLICSSRKGFIFTNTNKKLSNEDVLNIKLEGII